MAFRGLCNATKTITTGRETVRRTGICKKITITDTGWCGQLVETLRARLPDITYDKNSRNDFN
jgi:deoxycytidine triphosphate deaminase